MIVLHAHRSETPARRTISAVTALAARFPGGHRLQIRVGPYSRLTLGPALECDACEHLLAALREFGDVDVTEVTA